MQRGVGKDDKEKKSACCCEWAAHNANPSIDPSVVVHRSSVVEELFPILVLGLAGQRLEVVDNGGGGRAHADRNAAKDLRLQILDGERSQDAGRAGRGA